MRFVKSIDLAAVLLLACFLILLPAVYNLELAEGTQSQKTVVFIYGIASLFVLYGIRHGVLGQLRFRVTPVDLLVFLMLLYTVVRRQSFDADSGFSLRYQELIFLALLYLIFRKLPMRWYPVVLLAVVASGIVQAVYGDLQLYGYKRSLHGYFPVTGSFFNPAPFAVFIGLTLAIAAAMAFVAPRRPVYRVVGWISAVLILLLLPVTDSRAAWLAMTAAAGYLGWIKLQGSGWFTTGKHGGRVSRTTVVVVVMVLAVVMSYGLYRFKQQSADGRAFIWRVTATLVKQQPVWGHGYDTFQKHYMGAQATFFQGDPNAAAAAVADNVAYVYNEPLEVFFEGGVVGFLVFAGLYFALFRTRAERPGGKYYTWVARAGLIFYLVCSLFSYPSYILPVKIIVALCFALLARRHRKIAVVSFAGGYGVALRIVVVPAVVVLAAAAYRHASALQRAYDLWQDGQELYDMHSYQAAVSIYQEAYPMLRREGQFLGNYGKALYMIKRYPEALEVLIQCEHYLDNSVIQVTLGDVYKALKHYDEAERRYWQAWYRVPGRLYPKFQLVKLYEERGLYAKAIEMAEALLRAQPKVDNGAIDDIRSELRRAISRSRKHLPPGS